MTRSPTRRSLILGCALLLAAATGAAAQERLSGRAPVPRDGTIVIRTQNGSVQVEGWSRAEVSVQGDRSRDGQISIRTRGGRTVVGTEGSENLQVRVPAGSRVEVRTRTGNIQVRGVTGAVSLESSSGSFQISGSPRMVSVEGISGSIELNGSTEILRVKTLSGDIRIPRARGFVELSTVSGNIRVESRGVERGTLRNTSGRTEFRGSIPRDASLHFESSSGEIELRLPSRTAADFELTSLGGGEIDSELGPEPRTPVRRRGVEVLRFSTGRGGAEITARTVSGSIRLRRQ
ncbi:MAG TPA: DUF4097 family beta strand repeat-containing protein [Longimicrobiaceae bacterium]|nr:DUF4097 family beta strand repeat-containing protein [Longimicrobiaceae bacterium]